METNQDWSVEWVTFFDEYAGNFHPSFRRKLAKQLFEMDVKKQALKDLINTTSNS